MKKKLEYVIEKFSQFIGHPYVFVVAVLVIAGWMVVGFFMDFNQLWFDIIDIVIFVSTFLVLFVVQFSQNSDTQAMQAKLDDILKSIPDANNSVIGLEKKLKGEE